jgi:hypothetical protein
MSNTGEVSAGERRQTSTTKVHLNLKKPTLCIKDFQMSRASSMPSYIIRAVLATLALSPVYCLLAVAATNSKAMREALVADYPLTRVGVVMFKNDYNRITQPGGIYAVRVPGIYADVATTENVIVNTNVANGQVSQATGFTAAFGGNTGRSRTLNPNEKVYVTSLYVNKNSVLLELLTVDMTTLGDGQGTRYRAELNVKLPGLDDMTPDDVKKAIDIVITDPATASSVESKTVKLEMSPDEVKKILGNPDKIVDLGQKQIYLYKDMKITFIDAKVTDVQ